jgi:hypothetical protein
MTTPHRRRTNTDRPPPLSRTLHGNDSGRSLGQASAAEAAFRGRGDDVEDQGLPVAGSVQAATLRELDDARAVLMMHRLDPRAGRCAACAADCPCPPALDAARVLAEAGAWNTVPVLGPGGPQSGPERTTAAGGWVARVVRSVRRLPSHPAGAGQDGDGCGPRRSPR